MIRITSRRHNFRRCGVPHPKAATEYPDDRFSEEELAVLEAEPMLTVEAVAGEHEDPELIAAARQAIADGRVIAAGRPDLKAMAEILGAPVKAKVRDRIWETINAAPEE